MREPRLATTEEDIKRCFAVLRQLRTYLTCEDDFLQRVRQLEANQGYKLAFIEAAGRGIVGASGYAFYCNMERADSKCVRLFLCWSLPHAVCVLTGWGV